MPRGSTAHHVGVIPTPDAFHALARSSPWRWTTLHYTHRAPWLPPSARGVVEAWLVRPDGVRIATGDGTSLPPALLQQRQDGRATRAWRPEEPSYRSDGLVARRPGGNSFEEQSRDDGIYWGNYSWLAMLDPLELSHHVRVEDPYEDVVTGRSVWRARLVAEPGYQPRCGGNCCELLWSEAGLLADFGELSEVPERWRGRTYPPAYDVALDVQTGVVVRCHPVGDHPDAPWLENDIHDVDADLDRLSLEGPWPGTSSAREAVVLASDDVPDQGPGAR